VVAAVDESLIVLSDVHLGSDLVSHAAGARRRSKAIDRDLTRLIDHYRTRPPRRGRWRLVIAGDFIDFIGMVLPTEPTLETAPSEEERENGLGNARDHALRKMRAVAERHAEAFAALTRFVDAGNTLTIIHGNHDLELYWDDVRAELVETIARRSRDRQACVARIDFTPWFFYRDGMAYIEHGHQYDAYCATDHLLAPLSPVDPRRVARGFCDVLLRFVVRQTPGLGEGGHEKMGIVDYLRFAARLGAGGMITLAIRFARAVRELFKVRREHLHDATPTLRAQHEHAIKRFARARKLGLRRVRALWRLQVPPITRSISGIMASVLLDRLALGTVSILLIVAFAITGLFTHELMFALALAVVPAWIFVSRWLAKKRPNADAVRELAQRAASVATLFPAPFIVMGHTHVPAREPLSRDATYINVGSWAEDEHEDGTASRAHLVIHPSDEGPIAKFLRWDRALGPLEYET
jgi:UDP-2,3-diacylglucosamine pyrophosphatase LpxH